MAPRRVADDLATPEEDELEPRIRAQDAGDDVDDPDATDDEADEDVPQDDDIDGTADAEVREPRVRLRPIDDTDARLTAAEERAAAAEQRAIAAEARYQATQERRAPTESPAEEAARLALMTPEQLIDYKVNKALGAHAQTTQQMVLNSANMADKASFDTLISSNPALKKVAPDVEKHLARMMAQGQYPTRETVLKYVLGEQALKLARDAKPEGRERQRRVERERVRAPGGNRSDVQPQRRGGKTLEERLEGVQL